MKKTNCQHFNNNKLKPQTKSLLHDILRNTWHNTKRAMCATTCQVEWMINIVLPIPWSAWLFKYYNGNKKWEQTWKIRLSLTLVCIPAGTRQWRILYVWKQKLKSSDCRMVVFAFVDNALAPIYKVVPRPFRQL